jgi:hypothetical protein
MPYGIELDVSHHDGRSGRVEGFSLLWAWYVRGFKPGHHCQDCLEGHLAKNFTSRNAECGVHLLDEAATVPYVYVCGVASGPADERQHRNLHFPLRYWPGATTTIETYNGYRFTARNAMLMPVPALPDDFRGLPREHARCKNFQFGVAYFGIPSALTSRIRPL